MLCKGLCVSSIVCAIQPVSDCRPSIDGSLRGLMGLLAGHDLRLEQDGIVAISSALLELHIQGLAQADRMLALNVLLQLVQV